MEFVESMDKILKIIIQPILQKKKLKRYNENSPDDRKMRKSGVW